MIKFHKDNNELAALYGVHRDSIARRIKKWTLEVYPVPKGMKYYEIDMEAIIKDYIKESLINNK